MCECTAAIAQPQPKAPASLIYEAEPSRSSRRGVTLFTRSQPGLEKRKRAHAHTETLRYRKHAPCGWRS